MFVESTQPIMGLKHKTFNLQVEKTVKIKYHAVAKTESQVTR